MGWNCWNHTLQSQYSYFISDLNSVTVRHNSSLWIMCELHSNHLPWLCSWFSIFQLILCINTDSALSLLSRALRLQVSQVLSSVGLDSIKIPKTHTVGKSGSAQGAVSSRVELSPRLSTSQISINLSQAWQPCADRVASTELHANRLIEAYQKMGFTQGLRHLTGQKGQYWVI